MGLARLVLALVLLLIGCERETRPAPPSPAACGPVPGAPDARFSDDVANTKLSKRLPDEAKRHPELGITMSTTTLMMTFTRNATVAEVNAALCSAPVNVVSAMKAGILVVQVRDVEDFSDLDAARNKLEKHRGVESVATNPVLAGDTSAVPRGTRSRREPPRCAWAPTQIAKHYGLEPFRCSNRTNEVDGRDVHLGVLRIDRESTIYAIVDDDGVHPVRLHTPSAMAPGNILGLTAREIETQTSPKLSGQQHWSQKTRRGWHWVDVTVHRANGRVPRAPNPFGDLREQYRSELAGLHDTIRPCLDRFVRKYPQAVGEPVRVDLELDRDRGVGQVTLYDLGDKRLSFQIAPPNICIEKKLRRFMRFPPDHGNVNRVLFTQRIVLEPPGPEAPKRPSRKAQPFRPDSL